MEGQWIQNIYLIFGFSFLCGGSRWKRTVHLYSRWYLKPIRNQTWLRIGNLYTKVMDKNTVHTSWFYFKLLQVLMSQMAWSLPNQHHYSNRLVFKNVFFFLHFLLHFIIKTMRGQVNRWNIRKWKCRFIWKQTSRMVVTFKEGWYKWLDRHEAHMILLSVDVKGTQPCFIVLSVLDDHVQHKVEGRGRGSEWWK